MRVRVVALSVLAVLFLVLSGTGLATAAPPSSPPRAVTSLTVVDHGPESASAVLNLTFTHPVPERQVRDVVAQIGGDPDSVVVDGQSATASMEPGDEMVAMAGPTGQGPPCGSGNTWFDSQGTFNLQHQCGWTTVPWSWKMKSTLQASVVGAVSERGMDWWKNGVKQARQAPHLNYPANYTFHGTFSGAPTGTRIAYENMVSWRHNTAGGGNAVVSLGGQFYYYYW